MCVALVTWCVAYKNKSVNVWVYWATLTPASTVTSTNNDGDNPSVGSKRPQRESQAETSSQENASIAGRAGFLRFCF